MKTGYEVFMDLLCDFEEFGEKYNEILPNSARYEFNRIFDGLTMLGHRLSGSQTYIIIRDNETNETDMQVFKEGEYRIFFEASKFYAFSDLDDTYSIETIVFKGREVRYCGWDEGMHFVYKYNDTNEVAFENWYPQWDH